MQKVGAPSIALRRNVLGDVELRLLQVFAEIVRANGFSAAQASLGMTQATISAHMRHRAARQRAGRLPMASRGRRAEWTRPARGLADHLLARQKISNISDLMAVHVVTANQSPISMFCGRIQGFLPFSGPLARRWTSIFFVSSVP